MINNNIDIIDFYKHRDVISIYTKIFVGISRSIFNSYLMLKCYIL